MDSTLATVDLGALSQTNRLDAFPLQVKSEPMGLAAGEIARGLGVPANTLSSHLAILGRAGLVTSERHSRSIVYRADISALRNLMVFLANDCCGGSKELCAPLLEELAS